MTKQEAIDKAIEIELGRKITYKPGTLVGCKTNPISLELIRYEGEIAICSDTQKEVVVYKSDLFDVNQIRNIAMHLINLGYWKDGMEHTIVNFAER